MVLVKYFLGNFSLGLMERLLILVKTVLGFVNQDLRLIMLINERLVFLQGGMRIANVIWEFLPFLRLHQCCVIFLLVGLPYNGVWI